MKEKPRIIDLSKYKIVILEDKEAFSIEDLKNIGNGNEDMIEKFKKDYLAWKEQ